MDPIVKQIVQDITKEYPTLNNHTLYIKTGGTTQRLSIAVSKTGGISQMSSKKVILYEGMVSGFEQSLFIFSKGINGTSSKETTIIKSSRSCQCAATRR